MHLWEAGEKSEKVRGGETMVREGLTNQKLEQDFEAHRVHLQGESRVVERTLVDNIKGVAEDK